MRPHRPAPNFKRASSGHDSGESVRTYFLPNTSPRAHSANIKQTERGFFPVAPSAPFPFFHVCEVFRDNTARMSGREYLLSISSSRAQSAIECQQNRMADSACVRFTQFDSSISSSPSRLSSLRCSNQRRRFLSTRS